ncbi:hypothetical protein J2W42_002222 [Rhizobium tibeticum]|uniref:hypothetical protein n=1 Tax=Rhizobium tibeticum TaxID=501024 RepID=UPI00278AD557|nr:hypothetical protein [Rhizobium tibeticum]MDP9809374.1 hypothetical protein [Rhizobium tibeticum]
MNMAVFHDWTYDQVRARIVEAAETLAASPSALGPRMSQGAFSEMVSAVIATEYDRAPSYRRVISAGALTRMEETWTWINTYLGEEDRKRVYDYGFIKSRKGMFLEQYLSRNDMVRRTFERKIHRCCQTIASALNRKHLVRLGIPLDGVSQNHVEERSSTVSSDNYAMHWIASDGKPHVDPALPLDRAIDPRDIRARHSDKKRSLGIKSPA